jgi:hypothetical protein
MNKNEPNKAVLNELIDELIRATVQDDLKLKELDNSIDPASISYSTHLAKTIKEFINE